VKTWLTRTVVVGVALVFAACTGAPRHSRTPAEPTQFASSFPAPTAVPPVGAAPAPDLERRMREDLAARLSVPPITLALVSFRQVTWATGCIGINRPGQVCSQMLAPGFLAIWTDPDGATYRYHGSDDAFIAASFEPGATLSDPFPATP
jgi:hypothetical protein